MIKFLLTVLVAILFVVAGFAILLPFAIFYAYCLSTMWNWFIVPYGLPVLDMAHAYGISLVLSMYFGGMHMSLGKIKRMIKENTDDGMGTKLKEVAMDCVHAGLFYLCALGIGYIVHTYWIG
jgi:hypothetical protein